MTDPALPPDPAELMATPLAVELAALVANIAELDPDDVTADVPFVDVGIDSLMAIEIAVHVEQRYRTSFDENELSGLHCFADLVELTRSHLADR